MFTAPDTDNEVEDENEDEDEAEGEVEAGVERSSAVTPENSGANQEGSDK